jgi:malate dehydrogenase
MKVGIVGAAGSVGAPVAFYIAVSGLAAEVLLVDLRPNVVQQHALDLSTAASGQGVKVKAGTLDDMVGFDVVVNAAGVHQGVIADRMEMLPGNIPLVRDTARRIKEASPEAVVITATNPVDPLNYATWLAGGFDRSRVIGYGLNDSLRFRELVAQAKGVRPAQVDATVVGEHGRTQVPLFSSVRVDGRAVRFSEEERAAILGEIPKILRRFEELQAGRTAGWTCAVGMAALVRAIRDDSGEVFPCSAVLEGEYGTRGLSMGVPVSLGRTGIRRILEWPLDETESAALARSAEALALAARVVDGALVDGSPA